MSALTSARLIESAAARFQAAGLSNAEMDAETLFRCVSGLGRAALLTRGTEPVEPETARKFAAAVIRRENHEPIQYILGMAAFWRDDFIVTPAVLIPRPETEVLVEAVAGRLRGRPAPRVLDLGTGSGCIALSLLRELPTATSLAVDLSDAALNVAEQNAERLSLGARIAFRRSAWFEAIAPEETFDAVVSNPPYVTREDEASLPRDVRDFEPSLALFANEGDDLSSYRVILDRLGARLRPGAVMAFEVGLGQASRVEALMAAAGFPTTEVLLDLASIPRVVLGQRE